MQITQKNGGNIRRNIFKSEKLFFLGIENLENLKVKKVEEGAASFHYKPWSVI